MGQQQQERQQQRGKGKSGKAKVSKVPKVMAKRERERQQAQNNRNIEAVNKVSPELQQWLRTEIKKLNPDVEAASVAHLLLTLDDETAKTTAYHTFGSGKEVNTFIDSFLVHRSHDLQQQKNQKHAAHATSSSNKKKKGKK